MAHACASGDRLLHWVRLRHAPSRWRRMIGRVTGENTGARAATYRCNFFEHIVDSLLVDHSICSHRPHRRGELRPELGQHHLGGAACSASEGSGAFTRRSGTPEATHVRTMRPLERLRLAQRGPLGTSAAARPSLYCTRERGPTLATPVEKAGNN